MARRARKNWGKKKPKAARTSGQLSEAEQEREQYQRARAFRETERRDWKVRTLKALRQAARNFDWSKYPHLTPVQGPTVGTKWTRLEAVVRAGDHNYHIEEIHSHGSNPRVVVSREGDTYSFMGGPPEPAAMDWREKREMDLSGLDLEGMLKDLNRWAGRQAKRQKARSLGEQGASRTEIRERAGEDWAARIERERAKKARKARARKKRAEAGLAVYNPRRARRNTGYVAAKIRANTARKNPRLRDRFVFQAVRQKWGWGILYSSGPDFSYGQDETLGVVGTQEAMEELARDLNAGDKKALSWVNQKMREHYVGERPQKIRANTAKRNGLIPKKSPTGARPTVPKGDFTFLDFGPVALLAGEKSVEAVMLEGDYLWRDAALSRLKRMGFSSSEARSYLSSLPNIGAAVYSP